MFAAGTICLLRAQVRNLGWDEVVEDRAKGILAVTSVALDSLGVN